MSRSSPHPLRLSGDLSLRTISELKAELGAAVAGYDAIVVVTDAVESVDVAVLQLLASAARTAAERGRTLSLTASPGSPMARALVAAGFVAGDGSSKVPTLSWTIAREAA